MDGSRFDTLTRSFAVPKTRRGVLGSLTALGAGLLGASVADAQVSQAYCGNQFCASNPGGCKPGCVCCVYTNAITGKVINSRCRPPGTCSPGTTTCPPGQVPDPVGGCAAPTTTTTAAPDRTCPAGAGTCGGGSGTVFCGEGQQCACDVTTVGATVCRYGPIGVCFDCVVDADCAAVTGLNSFCLRGPDCCIDGVAGTFCAPPCPPGA